MDSSEEYPEVEELLKIHSEVTSSLESYRTAQSPADKSDALQILARNSRRLATASTNPQDGFLDFTFQPLANACVRCSLSLGLFEQLHDSEPRSSVELAKLTNSDPVLIARLLRTLAAFEIIQRTKDGNFLHTTASKIYIETSQKAYAQWMWDVMIRASSSIGYYFDQGIKDNPTDAKHAPFSFANGREGQDVFQIVQEIGESNLFVKAMSGSSVLCAKEAVATYAFDQLNSDNSEQVVLVDVGGSKGQTLLEIRRTYPNLKGRMVLQDLQSVLDTGEVSDLDAELQAHDFFSEIQPVKGAAAYFYQRIFHDWSDDACRLILQNLKPAMAAHSKLLICDTVLPNSSPSTRKVLRDINMLLVAGMERSETQWQELLEGEGFSILKIHGLHNKNNSIIEAALTGTS